jgi:hypothetical protein
MHDTDTLQAEAEAVATAATRQALHTALQDYWTAVAAWEETRRAVATTSSRRGWRGRHYTPAGSCTTVGPSPPPDQQDHADAGRWPP